MSVKNWSLYLLFILIPSLFVADNLTNAKIYDLRSKFFDGFNLDDFSIKLYRKVRDKNGTIFLIDKDQDVIKSAIINRCWEGSLHDIMIKYIRPRSIVLDVGGHIGTHAINFAKYIGSEGYVIAFEPNPKIFQELYFNINLNNVHNILALPIAIGDVEEMGCVIPQHPLNEGNTLFRLGSVGDVKMVPLDVLDIEGISFIKIDVEGCEKRVLLGATKTIQRERPVICIEIWSTNVNEVTDMLYKFNYAVRHIEGDDFLAIPVERLNRLESVNRSNKIFKCYDFSYSDEVGSF